MKLETKEITKSFGEKIVLKGINLSVESGRALGLLGRNGAGKTTTIRIVMQVFSADSGEVILDGVPMNTDKVKIGYLPEERGLYPKKEIMSQLIYFGKLSGMSKKEAEKSADKLLERLQMTEYRNKRLDTLSKGNQQKIQLVATLVANPDIIILDEPFSGLDPVNAMLLKDVVRELIADGKIVFFSSHQMNYIEEFCDDIAIISGGKIVLSGDIKEIKRSYNRNNIEIHSVKAGEIAEYIKAELSEIVGEVSVNADMIEVVLKSEKDKNLLYSGLSAFAADIDEFKVKEPSLNDIFVKYTEEGI
ncbi:MAG: ATP-binding cassette domain-containing protein [Oscillospiraceae bacterium]